MTDLPAYYFRLRENGAAVFAVSHNNRARRLEMDEIAVVNVKNGNVRPHGNRVLTEADQAAIADWLARRRTSQAARDLDDARRLIELLNFTAHWAQSRAEDAALDAITDELLMAMHDLRAVLVRKKADRLGAVAPDGDTGTTP